MYVCVCVYVYVYICTHVCWVPRRAVAAELAAGQARRAGCGPQGAVESATTTTTTTTNPNTHTDNNTYYYDYYFATNDNGAREGLPPEDSSKGGAVETGCSDLYAVIH